MNKLLLLLALSFLSVQSFAAGCPDGSEPVKSVSDDGSYFVYNCGGGNEQASSSTANSSTANSSTKVKVAMKPDSGDWIKSDGLPMWSAHHVKWELVFTERSKSYTAGAYAMGDFDGDGVDDMFILTNPKQGGVDWDSPTPNCNTSLGECYSKAGAISVFKVEQTPLKIRDGVYTSAMYQAIDVSGLLVDNNPIELKGIDSTNLHLADFNGDGKIDVFSSENLQINDDRTGKNDMYFLSNKDTQGWTESTATHVTGTKVKKGKGLINFSHGSTIGDIDGDGDIDIVVTSIEWAGGNGANQNGEIWCYVNQGDGHMKVRRCGNQWGWTPELGDIDNDGDLDLVWGSSTFTYVKDWNKSNEIPGCFPGKSSCNGTFNGILLNDGNGNFNKRGFSFPDDVKNSSGQSYTGVPEISVADLDGDGDLDVVRSHVGHNYVGAGMTIEENIGNGKFRTAFYSEFCASPKKKADFPNYEGNEYNCWVGEFKFGDFNKDGFIDIVLDGHDANNSDVVQDGAIYMSTGKFTYDIVLPNDEDFPLIKMKLKPLPRTFGTEKVTKALTSEEQAAEQKAMEDELAAFEAELAAELGE